MSTKDVLLRLKSRVKQDRGRFAKLLQELNDPIQKERVIGEEEVCARVIEYIDKEIKAL